NRFSGFYHCQAEGEREENDVRTSSSMRWNSGASHCKLVAWWTHPCRYRHRQVRQRHAIDPKMHGSDDGSVCSEFTLKRCERDIRTIRQVLVGYMLIYDNRKEFARWWP